MLSLLKEQTQVGKATIENFNSTIANLKHNEDIFNSQIEKFNLFSKRLSNVTVNNKFTPTVNKHYTF